MTAVFSCSRGAVHNLRIEGESAPVQVTAGHPFRTAERGWVEAGGLRIGEQLLVAGGSAAVENWAYAGEEPVFNLEVDADHCYRVGDQGILVHNASEICNPAAGSVSYDAVKTVTFTDVSGNSVTGEVGTGVIAYMTPASVRPPGVRVDLDAPSWWSKLQAVVKPEEIQLGHIFASTLGGTGGKSWNNLTPLYDRANFTDMKTCEGFLKKLVTECKYCVTVHIKVEGYGQNMSVPASARPAMPTRVVIDWVNDCGNQKGTFVINNLPGATSQNPCKVANLPCRP